jgi:hypothetical protein
MNGPTDADVERWLSELESDDPRYRMEALGQWAEGWTTRARNAEARLAGIRSYLPMMDSANDADAVRAILDAEIGDKP